MRRNKPENSWQSKIDPEIVPIITEYIDFISKLENSPKEGFFNLPNADFKPELFPNQQMPNEEETLKNLAKFIKETAKIDLGVLLKAITLLNNNDANKIQKLIPKIINRLPNSSSKKFYKIKFESFLNNQKIDFKNDKIDKQALEFFSYFLTLIIQHAFSLLSFESKQLKEVSKEYLFDSGFIRNIFEIALSMISQMANQITITELLDKIKKGDDKAIFQAITINKGLLSSQEMSNRIAKAQLTGDAKFFKDLGKAIAAKPLQAPKLHGKTYSVLKTFWFAGLYRLTNEELYDFLKHCGLNPPAYPDALQKFVQRHIKPSFAF